MTEANPQTSKEIKTREPVYLEHWCRDKAYKIKNSTFKSSNRWEHSKKKINSDNVLF